MFEKEPVHFVALPTPLFVSVNEVRALGWLYPYGLWQYTELAPVAKKFLDERFPNQSPNTRVIAITAHNGKGKQWGIILFRKGEYWYIVAQFGHKPFGLKRRIWIAEFLSCYLGHINHSVENPDCLKALLQRPTA